jgi:hypothetical protein
LAALACLLGRMVLGPAAALAFAAAACRRAPRPTTVAQVSPAG